MTHQDNSSLADICGIPPGAALAAPDGSWRRLSTVDKGSWLATEHSIVMVSTVGDRQKHDDDVKLILSAQNLRDALIDLMKANRPSIIPVGAPHSAARLNWESRWEAWNDARDAVIKAGGPVL